MQLRKTTSVPNPDWEPAQNNNETNVKRTKHETEAVDVTIFVCINQFKINHDMMKVRIIHNLLCLNLLLQGLLPGVLVNLRKIGHVFTRLLYFLR